MKRQEIIDAVHCSACNAPAGTPCWDNRGHKPTPRKHVHPARAYAATGGKFNGRRKKKTVHKRTEKTSKSFYETWEWKEARFIAFKVHGRKCLCCGWSPDQGGNNHLVVDHIKPIRTHPHLALVTSNHQVLCNNCNMGKSYKYHDDFRHVDK
jgi:5-methylcytosine-specific restriction endonuclease McrA